MGRLSEIRKGAQMEIFESLEENSINKLIRELEDCSLPFMKRLRVHFRNGRSLSIVRGFGTYGSEEGLFEIMEPLINDEPIGYLSQSEVIKHIIRIGSCKQQSSKENGL